MLEFDKSFFEGETRNDFYIEPMMKSAWAANLRVLDIIDKICQKHNIMYFADWGTLLGAVRHKGFIPWDDDIDICMKREDAYRFFEIMKQYQGELVCYTVYNTPEERGLGANYVTTATVPYMDRKHIKENYGFSFSGGVDIFIIDRVVEDEGLREEQLQVLRLINEACDAKCLFEDEQYTKEQRKIAKKKYQEDIQTIKSICHMEFSEENPSIKELNILYEEVSGLYNETDSRFYTAMHRMVHGQDYLVPKEAYEKVIYMPFENTTIPVPAGFDTILQFKYGENYMVPVNNTSSHLYPFYKVYINHLVEKKGNTSYEEMKEHIEKISTTYYERFLDKETNPQLVFAENYNGNEDMQQFAARLEVLEEVKRLCDENDLKIFAIEDTLESLFSGEKKSIEEQEIHMAMLRDDYNRFLILLQEKLDPWFDYRNIEYSANHESLRCQVVTDDYLCDEEDYRKRFHGCSQIVGIDIAAIDVLSDYDDQEKIRTTLLENLLKVSESMPSEPPYTNDVLQVVEQWRDLFGIQVDPNKNLRQEYLKAVNGVSSNDRIGRGSKVRVLTESLIKSGIILDRSLFEEVVEVPIANTTIPVPKEYKRVINNSRG